MHQKFYNKRLYSLLSAFRKNSEEYFKIIKMASEKYIIQSGDSAYKLAGGGTDKYSLRYQRLIEEANPSVNWSKLKVGQEIIIPLRPERANEQMNYSSRIIEFVKKHETFSPVPYDDGF